MFLMETFRFFLKILVKICLVFRVPLVVFVVEE